jgi:hypothetical protein
MVAIQRLPRLGVVRANGGRFAIVAVALGALATASAQITAEVRPSYVRHGATPED